MLHHKERHSPLPKLQHKLHRMVHFTGGKSRHDFVEKKNPGAGSQSSGNLQAFLVSDGKRRRVGLSAMFQLAKADNLFRDLPSLSGILGTAESAYHHVFQDRHSTKGLHHLKGSDQAHLAYPMRRKTRHIGLLEENFPFRGSVGTAHAVEKSGFPRSVGADKPHDGPLLYRKGDIVVRKKGSETLGDIFYFQQGHIISPPRNPGSFRNLRGSGIFRSGALFRKECPLLPWVA